eukprot:gene13001-14256_t
MDLTESNFYFKSSDDDLSTSKSLLTIDSAVITSIVLLGMFVLLAGLSARLRAEKHAKEEKEEVNRIFLTHQRESEIEGMSVDVPILPSNMFQTPNETTQKKNERTEINHSPEPDSPLHSSSSSLSSLLSSEEEQCYSSNDVSILKPPSSSTNLLSMEHVPFISHRNMEDFNISRHHHRDNNADDDVDFQEDLSSFDSSLDFELFN